MKPGEKGWLKSYLEFRRGMTKDNPVRKGSHPEHSMYRILQPTGLMYGQTVGDVDYPDQANWSEKDRMKVLLAESLVSSALLFNDKPVSTPEEISAVVLKTLENIGDFYNNIFPELATSSRTLFGRKKSPLEFAEIILDRRIDHTVGRRENFWTNFFQNSLLFLDVFIFGQWIHTNADRIVSDFFRYEREELRFSVAKVIAAAAHANKDVAVEEKKLFDFFLSGTDLSGERKREALKIFENGVDISEINLPSENSWILKKYFLEVAILTIWADKKVEEAELEFLRRFCQYLSFTEDDLENSLIAIEGFVLEHWEQLDYLQNKQEYANVSDQFIMRVARLAERNKVKISREIQASETAVALLRKAQANELLPEEKEQMRQVLIQVLRSIPTFVIVSLPQKFLTLPVLMKILPRSIFSDLPG